VAAPPPELVYGIAFPTLLLYMNQGSLSQKTHQTRSTMEEKEQNETHLCFNCVLDVVAATLKPRSFPVRFDPFSFSNCSSAHRLSYHSFNVLGFKTENDTVSTSFSGIINRISNKERKRSDLEIQAWRILLLSSRTTPSFSGCNSGRDCCDVLFVLVTKT
jgi:hypothetical protein